MSYEFGGDVYAKSLLLLFDFVIRALRPLLLSYEYSETSTRRSRKSCTRGSGYLVCRERHERHVGNDRGVAQSLKMKLRRVMGLRHAAVLADLHSMAETRIACLSVTIGCI
jgi:hypothetical protein